MGSKEGDKEKAAEAKKAKETEAQAKKAEKKAKAEGKKTKNAEVPKVLVTLSIVPPVDSGQIKSLEEALHESPDLQLVVVSGSATNGTEMVISAENSLPIVDILTNISPIAQVTKKGKTFQVTLKSE
jgi:alanyl-tRNA synthetase